MPKKMTFSDRMENDNATESENDLEENLELTETESDLPSDETSKTIHTDKKRKLHVEFFNQKKNDNPKIPLELFKKNIIKKDKNEIRCITSNHPCLLFEQLTLATGINVVCTSSSLNEIILLDLTNTDLAIDSIKKIKIYLKGQDENTVYKLVNQLNVYHCLKSTSYIKVSLRKNLIKELFDIFNLPEIQANAKSLFINTILSDFNLVFLRIAAKQSYLKPGFSQPDELLLDALKSIQNDIVKSQKANKFCRKKLYSAHSAASVIKFFLNQFDNNFGTGLQESLCYALQKALPTEIIKSFLDNTDINAFNASFKAYPIMLAVKSQHYSNINLLISKNIKLKFSNAIKIKNKVINDIFEYIDLEGTSDEILELLKKTNNQVISPHQQKRLSM